MIGDPSQELESIADLRCFSSAQASLGQTGKSGEFANDKTLLS
jgi:hypothetical protein